MTEPSPSFAILLAALVLLVALAMTVSAYYALPGLVYLVSRAWWTGRFDATKASFVEEMRDACGRECMSESGSAYPEGEDDE